MNTGEYGLEYPKLAEVRPLNRGLVVRTSLPDWVRDPPVLANTRRLAARAVTQFLRECASAQSH